ncbi:MAG: hypothetical protein NHB15_11945 [Methanosarcina barkeri]|nr:hypothetical protein [Methanosarcina sp. ERenArc_MAG2]
MKDQYLLGKYGDKNDDKYAIIKDFEDSLAHILTDLIFEGPAQVKCENFGEENREK